MGNGQDLVFMLYCVALGVSRYLLWPLMSKCMIAAFIFETSEILQILIVHFDSWIFNACTFKLSVLCLRPAYAMQRARFETHLVKIKRIFVI